MGDKQKDLAAIPFDGKKIIFKRDAWLAVHRELGAQRHIKDFVTKLRKLVTQDEKILLGN